MDNEYSLLPSTFYCLFFELVAFEGEGVKIMCDAAGVGITEEGRDYIAYYREDEDYKSPVLLHYTETQS